MKTRRWAAGDAFTIEGIEFRVMRGRKSDEDLRLEHKAEGRWRPTGMALGFLLADYWFENEEILYPRPAKGGRYYLEALERSAVDGWKSEQARLLVEKCAKQQREAQEREIAEPTVADDVLAMARAAQCCYDPEWHCDSCGVHLDNPYKDCRECRPPSVVVA